MAAGPCQRYHDVAYPSGQRRLGRWHTWATPLAETCKTVFFAPRPTEVPDRITLKVLLGRVALASLGFGLGVTAETGWHGSVVRPLRPKRTCLSQASVLGLVEAARATAGPMQEPLEGWGRPRQACR